MNKFENKIRGAYERVKKERILKRTIGFLVLSGIVFPLLFSFTLQNSSNNMEEFCRKMVLQNLDAIIENIKESEKIIKAQTPPDKKSKPLINEYRKARQSYKRIEFFIEYYSPFDSKFYINGPLVPKIEMEISSVPFQPQGFQVIEELLFTGGKKDFGELASEYDLLLSRLSFLREHYSTIEIEENKLHDALKLQLVRIMSLTLNGYDCTINKESITECSYAIEGVEQVLEFYKSSGSGDSRIQDLNKKSLKLLERSRKKLVRNPDSDNFDRLNFMVDYLDPAYISLLEFFTALNTDPSSLHYAVNFKAGSFLAANSINKQYFSVYITDTFNLVQQAELGKLLFFDPVLSGNNKRACASCHSDTRAFSDGLEKSRDFDEINSLTRNSPTLINAAYQKLFFHDGRLFNLEEQANEVFHNSREMNTSEVEIVRKLKQSAEYRQLFKKAFKNRPDTNITSYSVLKSLSEFIKTLDSRNSNFDKYLQGDRTKLTKDEINGYNLFSGKALCGSCHFFPLFNGTVPPMFNDNEFEVIGVPEKPDNKNLDPDVGRKKITGSEIHDHAFKTPTLRNIAVTAPYMHNGIYKDLDSVMVLYNRGGGAGSGLSVKNQTLPFDSLGLTKKELRNLKQFLLTLTDTSGLPKAPKRLPKFENEDLNHRKIGGEY